MNRKVKKLLIVLLAVIIITMIPVSVFIIKPAYCVKRNREQLDVKSAKELGGNGDMIHFLNTASSDAILIESDGKFALIDAGEDNDNPRGFEGLELEGFEEEVLAYLKENAAVESGKVNLDFVLGTPTQEGFLSDFRRTLQERI